MGPVAAMRASLAGTLERESANYRLGYTCAQRDTCKVMSIPIPRTSSSPAQLLTVSRVVLVLGKSYV